MQLKIGRHTYEITSKDLFLDNGACVQLLTQTLEKKGKWESKAPNPHLNAKNIKQIESLKVIVKTSGSLTYFKLKLED